jgi:uncharacterized phage infection (PIP) family protein YhgE
MADLLGQLQQSTDQARRLGDQFVTAGQRIGETRQQCENALKDCQAQYQPLQTSLQSCRDHLEARSQSLDGTAQRLIEQCRQISQWAHNGGQELFAKYAESSTQLAQASAQMAQSQSQLDQQRLLLSAAMMADVTLLNSETSSLVSELQATRQFLAEQMLPGLQQRQAALAQQGQEMGNLILNTLLPALTQEFENTRQHLSQLAQSLTQASQGNAEASKAATLSALESLAKSLDELCARSAEVTQNSLKQLTANTSPVRNRADELSKQARTFQELGTPASGHLKMLVNVVSQLQDLLIQAKVLSPGR